MAKYRVYMVAVVETAVDVEAEDEIEAVELAYGQDLPGLNISNRGMDMGEWATASDIFPNRNPDDDWELIE